MAGKREIKTTLTVDGEQNFKKAMSDAVSALKELSSEEKLAAAQFEATGDAEQYAADRTRILKSKIDEQTRAVEAAKEAIRQMQSNGVDPNSKSMRSWRTKLNQAKTTLIQLQGELDDTEKELGEEGKAFDDAATDAGEYKDQMDKVASAVDFTATIQAIENVRETIGKIISAAFNAGKALWNLERGAAGWADQLATDALVAELNVVDYQGWVYASQMIDSSVDSIRGAYKRLNKNLKSPTDEVLLELNELSVASLNLNGTARDTMDVFWDVVDALGRVENTSRRDQLAMDLFGRSFDELLPLIKAGSAAYKEFIEEGKQKAVSEESIGQLTELDDTINKLEADFNQIKYETLAALAPAFTDAANAADKALQSFKEFIDSEDGQKSLENLRNAIGGIANQIQNTDWTTVMNNAASVIKKITDSLGWLAEHSWVILTTIAGLSGAFALLTVSEKVLSVLQLLKTINWPDIERIAGNGAGSGVAETVGKKAGGTGVVTLAKNALKSAGPAIATVGSYVGIIGSTIAAVSQIDRLAHKKEWSKFLNIETTLPELFQKRDDEQAERYEEIITEFVDAINGSDEFNPEKDLTEPYKETFRKYANELLRDMPDLEIFDWGEQFADLSDGLDTDEIENIIRNVDIGEAWTELGRVAVENYADALENNIDLAEAAAEQMTEEVQAPLEGIDTTDIGYNVPAGIAEGIYDGFPLAVGAAEALGVAVSGAVSRTLEVRSPSKVMERIGRFVTMGFAKGIEENVSSVERATNRMAHATMGRAVSAAPAAGAAGNGGMVHWTFVMDSEVLAEGISPYVDGIFSAQVSRRR